MNPEPETKKRVPNRVGLDDLVNQIESHFASGSEITAKDQAFAFLRAFAGTSIKFPSSAEIERFVMAGCVWNSLKHSPTPKVVSRVEELYGIAKRTVTKVYKQNNPKGLKQVRKEIRQEELDKEATR